MNLLITRGDSHLSLGVLVTGPAMGLLILLFVGFGLWLLRHDWDDFDRGMGRFFGWLSIGAAVITAVVTAFAFYPYSGEYHHWQQISGTVTTTNSRFLAASGGGSDQKFVVTLDGSSQQFGCNDTRCAGVQVGDQLTITCKRSFQWFGTPGYDCNYVSYKPAGGAS